MFKYLIDIKILLGGKMKKVNQINFSEKGDVVPVAWGTLEGELFKINKCPICRGKHEHSGDKKYGPYQGMRVPHCKKKNIYDKRYALIAENLIPKDLKELSQ